MARRLKIDLVCSESDRAWLGEQLVSGRSAVLLAATLRRMGHTQIVARDVASWRDSVYGSRSNPAAAPTPEDRYCTMIEKMHDFCGERRLAFKASMIEAIEVWMEIKR